MKTKIIPFDLETAKKIQAGEAEGKIKYTEDDSHVYNAEIIKFDLIADKAKAKPNSTLFRTIVAIVYLDNYPAVRTFNVAGYGCNHNGDDTKLLIEVPDYESNKPQFKPFDKVLVRENNSQVWHCDFYSYTDSVHGTHYCVGHCGNQILPYEGNEHLIGTTDKPKEE